MRKLMCLLALVGLMVGCAHDHNAGGTTDQTQMNNSATTAPANTNSAGTPQ